MEREKMRERNFEIIEGIIKEVHKEEDGTLDIIYENKKGDRKLFQFTIGPEYQKKINFKEYLEPGMDVKLSVDEYGEVNKIERLLQ